MGVPDFGMFVSGVTEKLPNGFDYTSLGNFFLELSFDCDFRQVDVLHRFTGEKKTKRRTIDCAPFDIFSASDQAAYVKLG
jgi:hypothetical protein